MEISKNNYSFYVSDDTFSKDWFDKGKLDKWEQNTFHILEYYKKHKKSIYIDIGSWIGPTVLYSANIYDKVIAVEPDTVALDRLKMNLAVNNFNNVILIEKGLSDHDGTSNFGGNGELGNSESTMLINNKDHYLSYEGRHTTTWKDHNDDIIEIETITIETLLYQLNINAEHISLIKMDIEGGEIIAIPAMENFLSRFKPVLYISLHYVYLQLTDINIIIDILFKIYDDCYNFTSDGSRCVVNIDTVKDKKLKNLVFE
jgi:FkbM family methyltransferase